MKNTIPHFVSKQKLERLALEFFRHAVNGNYHYEVQAEDFPYQGGGFGEEKHVSRLIFQDKIIIESTYVERHAPGGYGSLGIRKEILKETKLLSNERLLRSFFEYLKSRVPMRVKV